MCHRFKCLLFAAMVSSLLTAPALYAQEREPVPIPNSQRFTIYSEITDLEYGIYVYLPPSYTREPDRIYPALYMLDGDTTFLFGGEIQRSLHWSNQIEEYIVVGIAYEKENMRMRDFSHGAAGAPGTGGSENFYKFINEELIPTIEADYRTSQAGRGLYGHSMGGMFTLWTMFTHTDTFERYIASSPVLMGMEQFEAAYAAEHDDLPVSCYIAVGEREGLDLYIRMLYIIRSRNYSSFNMRDHIIPDGVHGSVAPQSYSEGVRFVYNRAVVLPPKVLARYAGSYQGEGFTIDIQFAGDRLVALTDRIMGTPELFPASETVFYTVGWPNEFTFTLDGAGVPVSLTNRGQQAIKVE